MPNPLHEYADGSRPFVLELPAPDQPKLPYVDGLLAGAAEVDITPPPGMPKAGHSRNAQDGTGFRTRLKAKVIHLRQGETSLALIGCDLLAGSALVQRVLAREIADTDVPLSGLLMTATHTHAGPGQFSGSEFYNKWASNRAGFDPAYTAFLVDQLASAVREAVASRRAAKVAFGSTEVWGLTRNRSHAAYVRNDDVSDKRTQPQRKYAAINPSLHLLRVDDDEGPLATFTWFSIHGTGISHHDTSYNADVWAYVNGELADRVEESTGKRPVSAAAVCTHGDMTPAVRMGMLVFPEAERIGRGIGSAAAGLHETLTPGHVELAAGLREIDLSQHPSVDAITLPEPMIGLPKAAGANENTTFLLDKLPFFKPGSVRRKADPEQGNKLPFGPEFIRSMLVAPTDTFPKVIPVHLVRIGEASILGLPFEVTVEAGRRIGRTLSGVPVISSLANDHCDYLTTPEEYAAQHYEGASTLFGPRQQEFVTGCASQLAEDLSAKGCIQDAGPRRFEFSVHRYLARPDGSPAPRLLDAPTFVDPSPEEDAFWQLTWSDVAPGDLAWHKPIVRVEDESGTTVADDQGWRLGVTYLGRKDGRHEYAARWYSPPLGRPGKYRFVLEANAGQPGVAGALFD
jgi:neutral ceramidase